MLQRDRLWHPYPESKLKTKFLNSPTFKRTSGVPPPRITLNAKSWRWIIDTATQKAESNYRTQERETLDIDRETIGKSCSPARRREKEERGLVCFSSEEIRGGEEKESRLVGGAQQASTESLLP
jgi:hypothetical protein